VSEKCTEIAWESFENRKKMVFFDGFCPFLIATDHINPCHQLEKMRMIILHMIEVRGDKIHIEMIVIEPF
jgi:hypothetical protein